MSVIKDNRISDITFATRLINYLNKSKPESDLYIEELEYLKRKADKLLLHQANTATNINEKEYLDRCHPNGI